MVEKSKEKNGTLGKTIESHTELKCGFTCLLSINEGQMILKSESFPQ